MSDKTATVGKNYLDPALNSFTKTNILHTKNNLLKFQDPTLLGFKLLFLFDTPDSGLLCSDPKIPNTAMYFLNKRGDTLRMGYLKSFITLLKRINSECPWFWQSIEGLDDAWKHGFNEADFKPGIPTDRKITINTLDESVDLRMTALMDLYRKACFDWVHRREIVPRNLRWFNVSVYVYEARIFNRTGYPFQGSYNPKAEDLTNETRNSNIKLMESLIGKDPLENDNSNNGLDYINSNISRIMFDFTMCEWLPDESNSVVSSISHKEMGLKAQKIVFNYRNVAESNVYRMFHDKMVTDSFVSALDSLSLDVNPNESYTINGDDNKKKGTIGYFSNLVKQTMAKVDMVKNQYKDRNGPDYGNIYEIEDPYKTLPKITRDAAIRAENELIRAAKKLRQLFLGNVYGFSISTIANMAESGLGSIPTAIQREVGMNSSMTNNSSNNMGSERMVGVSLSNQSQDPTGSSIMGGNSLSNDDGPDATPQGSPNGNISLTNK